MAKPIPVSFKDNKRDEELYEYAKSKSSPSAYIKDLIEEDKRKHGNKNNNSYASNTNVVNEAVQDKPKNKLKNLNSLVR